MCFLFLFVFFFLHQQLIGFHRANCPRTVISRYTFIVFWDGRLLETKHTYAKCHNRYRQKPYILKEKFRDSYAAPLINAKRHNKVITTNITCQYTPSFVYCYTFNHILIHMYRCTRVYISCIDLKCNFINNWIFTTIRIGKKKK